MPFLQHLYKYPFLRLLIPLILGIIGGDYYFSKGNTDLSGVVFVSVLFILFVLLAAIYRIKKYSLRWIFGTVLFLFLLIYGGGNVFFQLEATAYPFAAESRTYRGVITQKPEYRENSVLCRLEVTGCCDSADCYPVNRNVLLYFPLAGISEYLKSGDEIIFNSHISPPAKRGNPDEFDYGRYLLHKNISGTGFVPPGNCRILRNHKYYSLRKVALDVRDKIIDHYKALGFDRETLSILAALTVGYKEDLSEEIRESFSVSGASHVLALSGLHIGFIYGFLAFFLSFLPNKSKGFQILKAFIIILLLWIFAFITGLSPSVVRSVIMFSVFLLSGLFIGKLFSFNSLCIAAFAMLLFRPTWLFDVGFQLSFCAVGAILIIQPWLTSKIRYKNKVVQYIGGLLTVSVAAQIGTAPLVLLYFSRFSTHFLLTNLVVIPLVFLIIHAAVIMLLFSPLPVIQQMFADVTQYLISLLIRSVHYVEQLPFSSFDNLRLYPLEVLGIYIVILLAIVFLYHRKPRFLIAAICIMICLNVYKVVELHINQPVNSIVFYNVRNCPAIHCIAENRNSWLVYADSIADTQRLERAISGYASRLRLHQHVAVNTDYEQDNLIRLQNIVWYHGKKIAIIHSNEWNFVTTTTPIEVDYLYVCNGYRGAMETLTRTFSAQQVIIDASITASRRKKIIRECNELNIPYLSTHEGAVIIEL